MGWGLRSGCDLLGVWVISVMAEYLSGEGFLVSFLIFRIIVLLYSFLL